MLDRANWNLIPDHMHGAVRRYFEQGIPPGHFLTAVLSNDLRGACERADDENRHRLYEYIKFFYLYAPAGSWGSPEAFERWIADTTEAAEKIAEEEAAEERAANGQFGVGA